jgi:hypothetical protein
MWKKQFEFGCIIEFKKQTDMEYNTTTIPNTDVFYIKMWQQNDVFPVDRYTKISENEWKCEAQKTPLENIEYVEVVYGGYKDTEMRMKDPKNVVYRGGSVYNRKQLQYMIDHMSAIISEHEMYDWHTFDDK